MNPVIFLIALATHCSGSDETVLKPLTDQELESKITAVKKLWRPNKRIRRLKKVWKNSKKTNWYRRATELNFKTHFGKTRDIALIGVKPTKHRIGSREYYDMQFDNFRNKTLRWDYPRTPTKRWIFVPYDKLTLEPLSEDLWLDFYREANEEAFRWAEAGRPTHPVQDLLTLITNQPAPVCIEKYEFQWQIVTWCSVATVLALILAIIIFIKWRRSWKLSDEARDLESVTRSARTCTTTEDTSKTARSGMTHQRVIVSRMGTGKYPKQESIEVSTCDNRANRQFKILETLGSGGFGKVRKVKKDIDSRHYALKGCPVPDNNEEIFLLLREAQTMASIADAQHVVRYYDAWLEHATDETIEQFVDMNICPFDRKTGTNIPPSLLLFIQLELCHTNLREWLAVGEERSDETLWDLFSQITEGLCDIHERGMIHRDVKPANVLLKFKSNGSIVAKLGDLGLAKFTTDSEEVMALAKQNSMRSIRSEASTLTKESSGPDIVYPGLAATEEDDEGTMTLKVGTLVYMAPEQQFTTTYSSKADMYALGIVLFEMFNYKRFLGSMKSKSHTCIMKLRQRFDEEPIDCPNPQAANLIAKLLVRDPALRMSARDLLDSDLIPISKAPEMSPAAQAYLKKQQKQNDQALQKSQEETAILKHQMMRRRLIEIPGQSRHSLFDCGRLATIAEASNESSMHTCIHTLDKTGSQSSGISTSTCASAPT